MIGRPFGWPRRHSSGAERVAAPQDILHFSWGNLGGEFERAMLPNAYQQTEPSQNSGRKVPVNREAKLARQLQNLLTESVSKFNRARRIETIQHFISDILQGAKGRLFSEVVQVRV
jgi:hypothetical protein